MNHIGIPGNRMLFYLICSRIQLNSDQKEIVDFAKAGHNLSTTGQGGVGKSEVVKQIIRCFKASGQIVGVICSSGITCQVFDRGTLSTVHSFHGLSTAELPWRQLVDRSLGNSLIRERVKALDVIIWDEASMSSRRMFELVNFLHHELATDELLVSKSLPFAGKQIIVVGEFLQLQPVPSLFDEGDFMFYSPLFDFCIPHRFALTKLMRQSEDDKLFLSAIADIRKGQCSISSQQYLSFLDRVLPQALQEVAKHIFFRKVLVQLSNRRELELLAFEASFENDCSKSMCWPGETVLHLTMMKQGHIGLDSAFDLWLLGHFKLRIFRLSHGASRTGV